MRLEQGTREMSTGSVQLFDEDTTDTHLPKEYNRLSCCRTLLHWAKVTLPTLPHNPANNDIPESRRLPVRREGLVLVSASPATAIYPLSLPRSSVGFTLYTSIYLSIQLIERTQWHQPKRPRPTDPQPKTRRPSRPPRRTASRARSRLLLVALWALALVCLPLLILFFLIPPSPRSSSPLSHFHLSPSPWPLPSSPSSPLGPPPPPLPLLHLAHFPTNPVLTSSKQ